MNRTWRQARLNLAIEALFVDHRTSCRSQALSDPVGRATTRGSAAPDGRHGSTAGRTCLERRHVGLQSSIGLDEPIIARAVLL